MKCKICGCKTRIWYKELFDDRHGYPGVFNILRCTNCGFGQTSPQIAKRELSPLYSNYYPRQNLDIGNIKLKNYKTPTLFTLWSKGLLNGAHFLVKNNSDVLDVGSGVGYSLLYLKKKGCKVYGIDPDKNAKKLAKKFGINFHQGFIEDRPFGDKKFDYVIASQVIEHTNNPISFLKYCKLRLKRGGKIILSFPNTDSLGQLLFQKNWLHWHIPYHLNHFNKKSVSLLSEKTRLKIVSVKTVTPNLWTNIQIRRLLAKPTVGVRDPFWDGGKQTKSSKVLTSPFYRKVMRFLENYNFINRVIDLLGFGESFVVTLSTS